MAELYIFSPDEKLLTILSEDTGLVSAPFRIEVNSVPDTPFSFTVEADAENAEHVKEENKVVFKDHEGDWRMMVIRELDDTDSLDGPETIATCEPVFIAELNDHIVVDRRFNNTTADVALDAALEGTRWIGEVEVELGLATTNFYYLTSVKAIEEVISTWGGEVKDVIEFDEETNEILACKIKLIQRFGTDTGQRFEIDHNVTTISRTVLSYPKTALYGRGASLQTENDGYTRYIDFADVEWSKAKGDPVDKPKGQKWVGDPELLAEFGYENGTKHRFGIYHNFEIEDPAELLKLTWHNLQETASKIEVNYRLSVDLFDDKVSLGDTAQAIDRYFARPIEIQARIIVMEYDLLDIEGTMVVEMGQFLNLDNDDLSRDVERLKDEINKPRPMPPIDNGSFPDIKPGTPTNVEANGGFRVIQLYWDYDSSVYISHYEVYGSQVKDFVPDSQHLLWRGRVSGFAHEVNTDEVWYYRVRAVNTHGTPSDYSVQVSASAHRVISDDILFGEDLAAKLRDLSEIADILGDGTVDSSKIASDVKDFIDNAVTNANNAVNIANVATQNANEAIAQAQTSFDTAQNALSSASSALTTATDALTKADSLTGEVSILSQTVEGFTTRVSNAEGNISALQQTASSLSTRLDNAEGNLSTITQTVNGLQTRVLNAEGNISTVTQLAGSLQTRITDAEGSINTLTQTASSLQSTITSVRDDLKGLQVGGRNYIQFSDFTTNTDKWKLTKSNDSGSGAVANGVMTITSSRSNSSGWIQYQIYSNTDAYALDKIECGETYTISVEVMIDKAYSGTYQTGLQLRANYTDGTTYNAMHLTIKPSELTPGVWTKFSLTKTVTWDTSKFNYWRIVITGTGNTTLHLRKPKLEKSTLATDWSPAPEDMATQSQITQLSEAINLRVEKNSIINQINLSPEGILIAGNRIRITGETLIDNGVIGTAAIADAAITRAKLGTAVVGTAQIEDAAITNAKIKDISADKIKAGAIRGIDVYGAKFRSSDGLTNLEIIGGNVQLTQSNGKYVTVNPDGLYGYNADKSRRFQANLQLVTSGALGTNTDNVYLAAQTGKEARVVDMNGIPGDGEVGSYTYLPLRSSGIYTNFVETNGGTSAVHLYLRPRNGGEVRITGSQTTDAYYPLRAGAIYSTNFVTSSTSLWMGTDSAMHVVNKGFVENSTGTPIYRDIYANYIINYALITQSTHAYVGVDGELRVQNKSLSGIWRDVRANWYYGNALDINTGTHIYVRPTTSGEARITATGTTGTYRPIRAREFITDTSLRENKKDINPYAENTLNVWRNAKIYTYHRLNDSFNDKLQLGMMLDEMPSITYSETGDSFALYALTSYVGKGLKDLISVTDDIKDDVEWLKLENQYLKQKIQELEAKVA